MIMLEPIDMAWELVRKVAGTTMFDKEFNDGVSLPFHVAKKAAIVMMEILAPIIRDEMTREQYDQIKAALIKLEL